MHLLRVADDMHKGLTYDHLHHRANNRPAGNRRPFYLGEREVMKKLTFEIRSPAHQQNAIHAVQQILPDPTKPIVVTIQERNRSLDQNRKLWACLGDVSRQVEWHGRWLDAESWKCVFTAALKQQDVVPNLAGNGFVVIGQSTSRMRVSEFAELLELIQAFGTERGVKWSDEARLALEWKARWGDRAA